MDFVPEGAQHTFGDLYTRLAKCLLQTTPDHEPLVQRVKGATSLDETHKALEALEKQLKEPYRGGKFWKGPYNVRVPMEYESCLSSDGANSVYADGSITLAMSLLCPTREQWLAACSYEGPDGHLWYRKPHEANPDYRKAWKRRDK